jgi:hypothetical protein
VPDEVLTVISLCVGVWCYSFYHFPDAHVCFARDTQLNHKSAALAEEITSLEVELREAAVRSGELAVTSSAQPNGVCVQLGALCLFLVEASWGWLGRDDQLLFPMVTEVEIHEQVSVRRCVRLAVV